MVNESFMIQTDQVNDPVTAVISHIIRPGREQGYEEWLHGIAAAAKTFDGHMGVSVIRPRDHVHPEYVAILRFDHYSNLRNWLESDTRQKWIERLQPLIEKPETIQTLTGLETWFTLPNQPLIAPPPRYKMVLVTWLGVFVTSSLLSRLLSPILSHLPLVLSQILSTGFVVVLLTYLVMPRLTQLFKGWLYPSPLQQR